MRILIALVLISNYALAQDSFYKIENFKQVLKIDGQLAEEVWSQIKPFAGFHNHFPLDSGTITTKTTVKAFHDGNRIYFGIQVIQRSSEYIIQSVKRDEEFDTFLKGDGFGIIIDPSRQQNSGYFFGVNVKGAQTDGLIAVTNDGYQADISWNAKWLSESRIDGNVCNYELAIPLNAIAFDSKEEMWGINFVNVNAKEPQHTTLTSFSRNYSALDLRFTQQFSVENLPDKKTSKLTLIPSIAHTASRITEQDKNRKQSNVGLDVKYDVTSSLKFDATINPDFSQVGQDNQITNLTRFDISFQERRNFFLENGDLFNNLGSRGVNPFYSRRIGAETDIQFGLKLSGKVARNTRIGLLNTQTEGNEVFASQNYTVLVARQRLTSQFATTGYLVNREATDETERQESYNRVVGLNLNYIAKNKKWLGQFNYAQSHTPDQLNAHSYYNSTLSYSTRKWQWTSTVNRVEENFITDVGFVPRLYNYDARTKERSRAGYWENYTEVIYNHYLPENLKSDRNEFKFRSNLFLNSNLELMEEDLTFIYFRRYKNLSYFFSTVNYNYNNLQYPTNVLNSETPLPAAGYKTAYIRVGYISPTNRKLSFQNRLQYGQFYNGNRFNWELVTNYRLQPWATVGFDYNYDDIDLDIYGKDKFHTLNFSGTIYFNKQLSWSNFLQYSTQKNQFNINSRLQWEFNPLSYFYLVVSDNYTANQLYRESYGVSIKLNYWLDF